MSAAPDLPPDQQDAINQAGRELVLAELAERGIHRTETGWTTPTTEEK